jgi:hypothetical protein
MNIQDYKKIIFSLNSIDPLTGVYYFNGCSTTYYLEEEGEIGYPKVMEISQWKRWYKEDRKVFDWLINTPFLDYPTYKNLSDITENEKYCYMINFFNVKFIKENKNIGFKCVPDRVLADVRNNKIKIVLHCSSEGYSGSDHDFYRDDLDTIQTWIDEANIPSENVVYINGNLLSNKIKSSNVKYHIEDVCVMDGWMVDMNIIDTENYSVINFNPVDNEYLYLNLNREPRPHRVYLLTKLVTDDLFNYGKNSFNMLYEGRHKGHYARDIMYNFSDVIPVLVEAANFIDSIGKKFIDIDNTSAHIANKTVNKNIYENTFISVIAETIILNDSILITEKTWKAIAIGHPFMILGSNGLLKQLHEMGYKTFNHWLDESYDDTDTIQEKIAIIVNNLTKLKEKSLAELIEIRNEMKDICIFNQHHFVSELRRKYFIDNTFIKHKPVLDILMKGFI